MGLGFLLSNPLSGLPGPNLDTRTKRDQNVRSEPRNSRGPCSGRSDLGPVSGGGDFVPRTERPPGCAVGWWLSIIHNGLGCGLGSSQRLCLLVHLCFLSTSLMCLACGNSIVVLALLRTMALEHPSLYDARSFQWSRFWKDRHQVTNIVSSRSLNTMTIPSPGTCLLS